jgi:membrane protease YdiL (CAAX protease family)
MRILVAKFVAVLTVAMLTATLNLIGMLATIWAFRLEAIIFQAGRFSAVAIGQVFALLLLFAAFFSAVLLAVTSFARSFKEAQAYLIPLILLSLAPGIVSLAPGLSLNGPICIVPLLNFVLLARDILQGQIAVAPAIIAIVSTLLYAALAIAVASRIFGTDAILYGSHESVRDSLRRPKQPQKVASVVTAIFCLTCLFPANFLTISMLGRWADDDLRLPLMIMGVATVLFFVGTPLLFAWHQRINLSSGFALHVPRPIPLIAAMLLGATAWTISIVIVTATQWLISLLGGADAAVAWQQRLIEGGQAYVDRWRQLPIGLILLTHALIPALAEEWFFRGFLLQSLLPRAKSAWGPILISGAIFGGFHLLTQSVIAIDRLLPTTLMGILLGYVCWRSGSIIPGLLVHFLNNTIVVCLAYFQLELQRSSWFPLQGESLPLAWIAALLALAAASLCILHLGTRRAPHGAQKADHTQSLI